MSPIRYLSIECEENNDPHIRERYTLVRRKFLENLLSVSVWGGDVGVTAGMSECVIIEALC